MARKRKNDLQATEEEKGKPYNQSAKDCMDRLDKKAIDSLSILGTDQLLGNTHEDYVNSLKKFVKILNETNDGNESDNGEDETTIGQILSDLPNGVKIPACISKSYDALKDIKLNSGFKVTEAPDYTSNFQVIEESAKNFEIAQSQAKALKAKFQMRESTEDESLRKRRQFILLEPENLPFTEKIIQITNLNEQQANGDGLGDEDMVMEDQNDEVLALMKCPITQAPLERAARAKCQHYFEYAAVTELFRNKQWLKCFTPGCPKERQGVRFQKSDVEVDEEMSRKIRAARQRLQRRRGQR